MVSAFWDFLKIHLEETEKDGLVATVCCESLHCSFPGYWLAMKMRKHVAPSPGWYCLEGTTCKLSQSCSGSCPFLKMAVRLDLSPCPSFP